MHAHLSFDSPPIPYIILMFLCCLACIINFGHFNLYSTQCTVHVYSCILHVVMKLLARDESLKQVHSGEDYQKTGDLQKLTAE